MVKAIWASVLLIAFLIASTMVDIVFTKKTYENSRKQIEAIERLNTSINEVQKSIHQLSRGIEEALEIELEPRGDESFMPNEGKI